MSDAAGWGRVEAALDELLALPPEQRAEALARLCGDAAAMRMQLESLLAETSSPDTLLDRPAVAVWQPEGQPEGSLPAGARLGAWRIAGLIGRGGMGEVYRAERADGQFEQQVALKLIRRDAAGEPRRFTAERQILARLEHPGIARLLDGGVADDGRPYMVMELVQGGAITQWCGAHECPLEQRLRLFMAVCEAVAYAHCNLVIHRDLKPGNVMVTAAGEIKLLDFGIAKLLKPEGEGGGAGDVEQTRHVPLTLGYAAPEQLAGGPITTAADVYALGMLLYELLSGRRPWSLSELSMPAALDKVLREPPPPPSRGAAQGGAPPVPPRLLRGDLDAIVAKALRKEPEKRYATVEALREDVARHLAGETVAAREGAKLYAASRFLRRNWLATAATAAVLLAIVGGSFGIAWQARRAEYEARKATAVKDFVVGIFKANGIDNPDGAKARATTAEQLLDLGAKRIRDEMQGVPEVRAELLGTIGGLYTDLNLGERAITLLQEQIGVLQRIYGDSSNKAVADARVRLASAQVIANESSEAEQTLQKAMNTMDQLGDHTSITRARALHLLAHIAYQSKPIADPAAEQYALESIRITEAFHPEDTLRIATLIELARISARRKDNAAAESWFQKALYLEQQAPFNKRPSDLAGIRLEYGDMLSRDQKYDQAEKELREALAEYLSQVGPEFPQTSRAKEDLAGVLFETGRLNEARPLMAEALSSLERTRGVDDLEWTADARIYFARLLFARGEFEEADRLFDQSESSLRAHAPASVYFPINLRWRAELLTAQGRWVEAEKAIAEAKIGIAHFYGEQHERYAGALLAEANLRLAEQDARLAESLYQRVIEQWPGSSGHASDSFVYSRLGLARVRLQQKQPADAELLIQQVLARTEASPEANYLLMQEAAARLWLGEAQLQLGKLPEAQQSLRRAVSLRESMDSPSSPWLAQARVLLAACLFEKGEGAEASGLLKQAAAILLPRRSLGAQFLKPLQLIQHERRLAPLVPASRRLQ
ncbi:MAG TPA: protein kinase [Nevskia sp.]|nr:protein kinase [Nevskia sp.]